MAGSLSSSNSGSSSSKGTSSIYLHSLLPLLPLLSCFISSCSSLWSLVYSSCSCSCSYTPAGSESQYKPLYTHTHCVYQSLASSLSESDSQSEVNLLLAVRSCQHSETNCQLLPCSPSVSLHFPSSFKI